MSLEKISVSEQKNTDLLHPVFFNPAVGDAEVELHGICHPNLPADARLWASWDYFRDDFSHDELIEQLEAVRPLLPKKTEGMHYLLQMDDGYCGWGDWDELKKDKFPQGIDGLVRDANARGFDVGIWMAPFWAESTSQVAQAHPDWFLRDGSGNPIRKTMVEHTLLLFDYSQDEVCEWWRKMLKMYRSWGIIYFKFDFKGEKDISESDSEHSGSARSGMSAAWITGGLSA